MLRIYAEHNPAHLKGGNFHLRKKVSTVDKIEAIDLSLVLVSPVSKKSDKGVMLSPGAGTV